MVWSPCCSRDSQESSPAPQFESINSSLLSLLYSPMLTSMYLEETFLNHWLFDNTVLMALHMIKILAVYRIFGWNSVSLKFKWHTSIVQCSQVLHLTILLKLSFSSTLCELFKFFSEIMKISFILENVMILKNSYLDVYLACCASLSSLKIYKRVSSVWKFFFYQYLSISFSSFFFDLCFWSF